jgi:hypothetical protein
MAAFYTRLSGSGSLKNGTAARWRRIFALIVIFGVS